MSEHQSGYAILRKRVAALRAENEQLQDTIAQQASRISFLSRELNESETARLASDIEHDREKDEMLEHMGWWRRFTWFMDYIKEED